ALRDFESMKDDALRKNDEKWQGVVADVVADKDAALADKDAVIADKKAENAAQAALIAELRAQLGKNQNI
ncbi:MAG: hypothetical protein FWG74_03865, partial [Planctomycetes bacterium]|nr:hypothetical protein [Planctomycetota bacterium]